MQPNIVQTLLKKSHLHFYIYFQYLLRHCHTLSKLPKKQENKAAAKKQILKLKPVKAI